MYGDRGRGRRGGLRAPPPHRYYATQNNNRNARFNFQPSQNYRQRPPRFPSDNRDENWQYSEQYDSSYEGHHHQPARGRRYGANYQPLPLQTYFYTSGVAQPSPEIQADEPAQNFRSSAARLHDANKTGQAKENKPPFTPRNIRTRETAENELDSNANMAERLTKQLSDESYECMICCESVRAADRVWSCSNCYHVFHLQCIQEWSRTSLTNPGGVPETLSPTGANEGTFRNNSAAVDLSSLGFQSASSSGRGRRANTLLADLLQVEYVRARNSQIYGSERENEMWVAASGDVATYLQTSNNIPRESADNLNRMLPSGSSWRCPGCQFLVSSGVPSQYRCFCGKIADPAFIPGDVPHTCGEMCGKKRSNSNNNPVTTADNPLDAINSAPAVCVHPCTLLCHPGPCPPCEAMTTRDCDCGKQTITVRCDKAVIKCDQVCGRELSCKKHKCEKTCHRGSCGDCTETVEVNCFCAKNKATRVCSEIIEQYSCKEVCGKSLNCGNHKCEKVCHSGECAKCETSLDVIQSCPCGKFPVSVFGERLSCLDKIPTCGNICGKVLRCGPTQQRHRCQMVCHTGPCPLCPLETQSQCRCGANTITVKCQQIIANDGDILCTRVCKRKLHCNKHQCRRLCCVESEAQGHVCSATCNRLLSCGVHQCQENCHRGNCDRCWQFSFDDLSCHCGRSSIPAPVACGTDPPTCDYPCMRPHPCGHTPQHTCHSEEKCPPCPVLIEAACVGGHQMMRSVPCYIGSMSCGRPCNKGLPSCDHLCTQTCHSGSCLKDGESCQQKCQVRRLGCGHACNETCHYGSGDCPPTPCKQLVPVSCVCNRVKGQLPCHEYAQRSKGFLLESVMGSMSLNSDNRGPNGGDANCYKLPCKDSCKRDAWLQRLDDAFGPIGNSRLVVPYTDFLIQMGITGGYAEFIYELEKTCFNLVQNCVDTGMRQQFAFKPMTSTKRRIIHELAEYYGLESQAYDEEPMKHVVIFGYRNRVKIPDSSLTSVIAKRIREQPRQQPAPGVITMPRSNTAGSLSSFPPPSRPSWGVAKDEVTTVDYRNQQDNDGWTVVGSAQFTQSSANIGPSKPINNTRQINNMSQASTLGASTNWASNFTIPGQRNESTHPTSNINWPYPAPGSTGSSDGQIASPPEQSQNSQWTYLNPQWGSCNMQINFQNVAAPGTYEQSWAQADLNGGGAMQANPFQMSNGAGEGELESGLVSLGSVRSIRSHAASVSSASNANNNHLETPMNNNTNRFMMIDHFDS